MKNELTCAVVRDLLPSFVEGLTSEETNGAVERHLAECPACAKLRADMAAPEETPETAAPVVDYLKTVKRRTGRQVCRRHERTAARVIHQTRRSVFQRVHRIIHHAASCLLTAICKTPALSTYAMIVPSVSVR